MPEDEIPTRLLNLTEGSLVVIDEVQNLWPSGGSKEPPEDITYLTKHRHHGLEIVLITQAPQLVHAKVLAVVDKHLHIRKSWFGRQIFEWPEYCSTTRAVSSRLSAVRNNYKIPKQAYGLYRSASMHVTQKMTVPIFAYMIPLIIIFVGYFAHKSYNAVMTRANPQEVAIISEAKAEPIKALLPEKPLQPSQPSQPVPVPTPVRSVTYVVSEQVDWSKVSACVANTTQCACYGHKAERIVVPPDTCRNAVQYGWPGKST